MVAIALSHDALAQGSICTAKVLARVASDEDPASFINSGDTFDEVTEYVIHKKNGEAAFCQHGGYCYPATQSWAVSESKQYI